MKQWRSMPYLLDMKSQFKINSLCVNNWTLSQAGSAYIMYSFLIYFSLKQNRIFSNLFRSTLLLLRTLHRSAYARRLQFACTHPLLPLICCRHCSHTSFCDNDKTHVSIPLLLGSWRCDGRVCGAASDIAKMD
jgi:hypothetical protein